MVHFYMANAFQISLKTITLLFRRQETLTQLLARSKLDTIVISREPCLETKCDQITLITVIRHLIIHSTLVRPLYWFVRLIKYVLSLIASIVGANYQVSSDVHKIKFMILKIK